MNKLFQDENFTLGSSFAFLQKKVFVALPIFMFSPELTVYL